MDMILNDMQITELVVKHGMIDPFIGGLKRASLDGYSVVSYGLSSMGYDIRVGNRFLVCTDLHNRVLDIKRSSLDGFHPMEATPQYHDKEYYGEGIVLPPHSFALAESVERFQMPRHVLGICLAKSSYARNGIMIPMTPLEPGWEGTLTIEISNSTSNPVVIYAYEGICQIIFLAGENCLTSYGERNGKYQNQRGIVLSRM